MNTNGMITYNIIDYGRTYSATDYHDLRGWYSIATNYPQCRCEANDTAKPKEEDEVPKGLTKTEAKVWRVMKAHGEINPTVTQVAALVGASDKTARKAMKRLTDEGLL